MLGNQIELYRTMLAIITKNIKLIKTFFIDKIFKK